MELNYEGKMVGINKRTLEALWDAQNFLRPSFCGSHRLKGMGVSKLPRREQLPHVSDYSCESSLLVLGT